MPNERGFAHILALVLFILLLGLAVGVYLVQNPTVFKPRAFDISGPICSNRLADFSVNTPCSEVANGFRFTKYSCSANSQLYDNQTDGSTTSCKTIKDWADSDLAKCGSFCSASASCPAGLVSYWNLNDSGSTVVDSVGSNSGTATSSVSNATGKIGTAKSFNAASGSMVNIGNKSNLNLTTFTVTGWINRAGRCAYNTCPIFSKGESSNTGYALELADQFGNGDYRAVMGIRDGLSAATGTSSFPIGTWKFVAASVDGSRIKLYVNGALEADVAQSQTPVFWNNASALIGARNNGGDVSSNASVDEVGVWNRVLSAGEITSLYNGGTGLSCQ